MAALAALPARFEAHLVGGVLRDRLLGGDPRDVDAVVTSDGEEAAERLAETLGVSWFRLGGDRFAAYRMEVEGFHLDVWDRQSTTVEADLRRRDLTINSLALRLQDFELLDPFGGLEDLDRRRLRATSESAFTEDPLRVLRLVRFAAELSGFSAAEETVALARHSAPALESVASERIRQELRSAFSGDRPDAALRMSARVDLYPGLWTGGSATGLERPAPELPAPIERLRVLGRRVADLRDLPTPRAVDRFIAAQAVLFAELLDGTDRLSSFETRRLLAARDAHHIRRLLDRRRLPSAEPERRWLLHRAGALWPTLAAFLGSAASDEAWNRALRALDDLAAAEADAIFAPPPLLDGNQIASLLGLEPGPRLGELVAALRRAQIEGRIGSPETAADFLRDLEG